ncbi:WhiB family transcriptional regulator [Streptomyces rochei]|uniref:WhiB family transcriptional regulator n=1 Tax=Streptomyces rochei TaxID=1928 RepID=UPI0036F9DBFF
MVLYDSARRWVASAICREEDDKLFFAAAGGLPDKKPARAAQALYDQAKEICQDCPVLRQCQRDTLGEEYGVYGGRDPHERYLIRQKLAKAVKGWPLQRRLAWAEEIHRLRADGMLWKDIQTFTGITKSAGELLVRIWDQHLEEQEAPEVVEIPTPEPVAKKPFPARPGRRHAWVRHTYGAMSDAWYRGQTADGKWVYMTTFSGRGQVHKWFPADDVHLYRPQAVVILNYRARPDDQRGHDLTA